MYNMRYPLRSITSRPARSVLSAPIYGDYGVETDWDEEEARPDPGPSNCSTNRGAFAKSKSRIRKALKGIKIDRKGKGRETRTQSLLE